MHNSGSHIIQIQSFQECYFQLLRRATLCATAIALTQLRNTVMQRSNADDTRANSYCRICFYQLISMRQARHLPKSDITNLWYPRETRTQ